MGSQLFDLFMLGIFSCLDAILGRPMEELLNGLPLSASVRGALLGSSAGVGRILQLAVACEHADVEAARTLAASLSVDQNQIARMYRESVEWAAQIFRCQAA